MITLTILIFLGNLEGPPCMVPTKAMAKEVGMIAKIEVAIEHKAIKAMRPMVKLKVLAIKANTTKGVIIPTIKVEGVITTLMGNLGVPQVGVIL